jgi:hypothetical protein
MQLRQVDERVAYVDQLEEDSGPVVLINDETDLVAAMNPCAFAGLHLPPSWRCTRRIVLV